MGNDKCNSLATKRPHKNCTNKNYRTKKIQNDINSWVNLPTLVLHDIFTLLEPRDRLNASSVCHNWRQALYHPLFFPTMELKLNPATLDMQKSCYLINSASHLVRHTTIKYFPFSVWCIYELTRVLERLTTNYNLKSLVLEPTHCHLQWPSDYSDDAEKVAEFIDEHIIEPLATICQRLEVFSLGCCEDLCNNIKKFLNLMARNHGNNVQTLGLASMKDDPGNYEIIDVDLRLFKCFPNLKILSVDYDYVSDEFLESLRGAKNLERLVVHIHGLWDGHPGTTQRAWEDFRVQHPKCLLRLTLIHAYEAVRILGQHILCRAMPLSHLKVFFCEELNTQALDLLSSWYGSTLQSIVWVDSRRTDSGVDSHNDSGGELLQQDIPDPFVMAAWTCEKLEEIILLGYKYYKGDIVALARLRGRTLKKIVLFEEDLTCEHCNNHVCLEQIQEEISKYIGYEWSPLSEDEVHPVIKDATSGDSDDYLMPLVLADLK